MVPAKGDERDGPRGPFVLDRFLGFVCLREMKGGFGMEEGKIVPVPEAPEMESVKEDYKPFSFAASVIKERGFRWFLGAFGFVIFLGYLFFALMTGFQ